MSDISVRLKEMAQLSLLSGRISEIHEKNLRMYSFIFFNGVMSCKIDYNLDKNSNEPLHITYNLEIDNNFFNDKPGKRFEALETATRTLFWKDLTVAVNINGKSAFRSKENGQ